MLVYKLVLYIWSINMNVTINVVNGTPLTGRYSLEYQDSIHNLFVITHTHAMFLFTFNKKADKLLNGIFTYSTCSELRLYILTL